MSDVRSAAPPGVKINQDANIFVSELDPGTTLHFDVQSHRQLYFLCMEGDCVLQQRDQCSDSEAGSASTDAADGSGQRQTVKLQRHEAAELYGRDPSSSKSAGGSPGGWQLAVSSTGSSSAHVLMVEMQLTGGGREDL